MRRLDAPREMDDAVRAAEDRHEVVALDVGGDPRRLRSIGPRTPPRDADDLVHRVVRAERSDEARADVARRSDDHDAAHGRSTTLKQPSSFFWKSSYAFGASSSGR